MKAISLRQLKSRLGEYVKEVTRGEIVLVTNRGEVVAELRSPGATFVEPTVSRALADMARRTAPQNPELYKRMPWRVPRGTANSIIDEGRGDR